MATNLTGNWRGTYSFDHDDKLPKLPVRAIPFDMTLKQGLLGFFTGTAQDDPKIGMAEPAKIKGRLKRAKLVFSKLHPVVRLIHEGKFESMQQLADRYGVALDEYPPAHPRIQCAGTLSDDSQSVTGTWLLLAGEIHVPGSRHLDTPELTGTWSMKRLPEAAPPK